MKYTSVRRRIATVRREKWWVSIHNK